MTRKRKTMIEALLATATRVAGDENHRAHHRFATRFHLEMAVSGRLSEASARSFSRTCSGVSFGPDASLKRSGRV